MSTPDKREELLGCPFCGILPSPEMDGDEYYLTCDNEDCPAYGGNGPRSKDEAGAIKLWNTRAPTPTGPTVEQVTDWPGESYPHICIECDAAYMRPKRSCLCWKCSNDVAPRKAVEQPLNPPNEAVTQSAMLEWRTRVMRAQEEQIATLKSRVEELQDNFIEYGNHYEDCTRKPHAKECSCGFLQAVAACEPIRGDEEGKV